MCMHVSFHLVVVDGVRCRATALAIAAQAESGIERRSTGDMGRPVPVPLLVDAEVELVDTEDAEGVPVPAEAEAAAAEGLARGCE